MPSLATKKGKGGATLGAQDPLCGRWRGLTETRSGLGGGEELWTPWSTQGGDTEDSKLTGDRIKLAFSESKLWLQCGTPVQWGTWWSGCPPRESVLQAGRVEQSKWGEGREAA